MKVFRQPLRSVHALKIIIGCYKNALIDQINGCFNFRN